MLHTLLAVVSVGDAGRAAHGAAASSAAKITLHAQAHNRVRPHVAVADHALALALFAEPSYCNARCLPTHNEVGVVSCHIAELPQKFNFNFKLKFRSKKKAPLLPLKRQHSAPSLLLHFMEPPPTCAASTGASAATPALSAAAAAALRGAKDGEVFAALRSEATRLISVSRAAHSATQSDAFMARWMAFKPLADTADSVLSAAASPTTTAAFDSEGFFLQNAQVESQWRASVEDYLHARAQEKGFKSSTAYIADFCAQHVAAVQALPVGYRLNAKAVSDLKWALAHFLLCSVDKAPFSLMAVLRAEVEAAAGGGGGAAAATPCALDFARQLLSVSDHCLAMASHWLRHPPVFLTVPELEELIVLSLFHDVFYFSDFATHDEKILELLGDYLISPRGLPRAVIANHLSLRPIQAKVDSMAFASEQEALEQEWVQMDW